MPSLAPQPYTLGELALGLDDWAVIVDDYAGLAAALDDPHVSSALVRVAGPGSAGVFRDTAEWRSRLASWALVIDLGGMSAQAVSRLARASHLFVLDRRLGHLIAVHSHNPAVIDRLLRSGWVEPDFALAVSSPGLISSW